MGLPLSVIFIEVIKKRGKKHQSKGKPISIGP